MTSDGSARISPDLHSLLGSRICHDLISPLGAISNGVELLGMTENAASPEMSLITDSVESANARIRFYRIAFGSAKYDSMISLAEIPSVLADVSKGTRHTMAWEVEEGLERPRVKLAFLLILCLESAMPFGGHIRLKSERGRNWTLTGAAERLKVADETWRMIHEPDFDTEVSPKDVHFALIHDAARRCSARVEIQFSESLITIRL